MKRLRLVGAKRGKKFPGAMDTKLFETRPKQILVVTVPEDTDQAEIAKLSRPLREKLGDDVLVLVTEPGVTFKLFEIEEE